MELIRKYFDGVLTDTQMAQFAQLAPLYRYWNQQINVIARTDIDNLYERHVLHSLAIAKVCPFVPGTAVVDVGTGGGFPGLPLAILFPDVSFLLIDAIGKKIKVVDTIAKDVGLVNVKAEKRRAETLTGSFDFLVSRAVTKAEVQVRWADPIIGQESRNDLPNGLLLLKGGDLQAELAHIHRITYTIPVSDFFDEPFFQTKSIVYISS